MIFLAPYFASKNLNFLSGSMYLFFSNICHQIPERSFYVFGKQLAVCSRCIGLYLGFLGGTILYPFIFSLKRIYIPPKKALMYASIPIAIDIFIRTLKIAENSFESRFITGFVLGTVTVFFVIPGVLSLGQTNLQTNKVKLSTSREKDGRKTG